MRDGDNARTRGYCVCAVCLSQFRKTPVINTGYWPRFRLCGSVETCRCGLQNTLLTAVMVAIAAAAVTFIGLPPSSFVTAPPYRLTFKWAMGLHMSSQKGHSRGDLDLRAFSHSSLGLFASKQHIDPFIRFCNSHRQTTLLLLKQ